MSRGTASYLDIGSNFKMTNKKRINQLIGYGILVFVSGFVLGLTVNEYLQLLMPLGTISTYLGIIIFFKTTDLKSEFTQDKGEDPLSYFWNKIVLKFWSLIFAFWMFMMNIILVANGFLD